jgi:hypothetical protein
MSIHSRHHSRSMSDDWTRVLRSLGLCRSFLCLPCEAKRAEQLVPFELRHSTQFRRRSVRRYHSIQQRAADALKVTYLPCRVLYARGCAISKKPDDRPHPPCEPQTLAKAPGCSSRQGSCRMLYSPARGRRFPSGTNIGVKKVVSPRAIS